MKHTLLYLVLALFVCACHPENGPINDLENLVEDLEANSGSYTAEDWEAAAIHYDAIMAEMEQYKYTLEQQKEISRLKSKVSEITTKNTGSIIKQKMKQGFGIITDFGTEILQTADSLMSEIED